MSSPERWLFIDPQTRHFEGDRLFGDGVTLRGGGVDVFEAFSFLRRWLAERGVRAHTADQIDSIIGAHGEEKLYVSFGLRERYRRLAKRSDVVLAGLFAFECPIVEPSLYRDLHSASRVFRRIYSYSTEEALRPFLTGPVELTRFMYPEAFDGVDESLWANDARKFLVMINANKVPALRVDELYTERLRALAYFARRDEVDLYGVGWDGPAFRVGDRRLPTTLRRVEHELRRRRYELRPPRDEFARAIGQTYRGPTADKAATLAAYTFALCLENSKLEGWITEKIFDCFYTGTIPIYLGAPDVDCWIPRECFVDMRRFGSYDDLRAFLLGLSPAQIEGYREAARDFLGSERYRPFSKHAFAEQVGALVEEITGGELEQVPAPAAAG